MESDRGSGPTRLVVFDVGSVLVRFDHHDVFTDYLGAGFEDDPRWKELDLPAMNLRGDLGSLYAEVELMVGRYPAHEAMIRTWVERWHLIFTPEVPGTADVLRALKRAGVRIAAMTNFPADMWPRGQAIYPVLKDFDLEFVSGREGVVKPDPAFYERVEAGSGCAGGEIFFIDDKAENIAAAQARGWSTYHFGSAEGLTAALAEAGVTTDQP